MVRTPMRNEQTTSTPRRPDSTTGTCIDSCDTVHSARCTARSTSHIGDNIQQSSIFMASRVS